MVEEHKMLKGLSDAMAWDDGAVVSFRIERRDGATLDVFCPVAELGDIFCFLGMLAKAATEERAGKESLEPHQTRNYLAPVPATGIGLQHGDKPDETLLVMRLSGFDMAFSVPSSGLAALADGIGRTARTLSAGSGAVN